MHAGDGWRETGIDDHTGRKPGGLLEGRTPPSLMNPHPYSPLAPTAPCPSQTGGEPEKSLRPPSICRTQAFLSCWFGPLCSGASEGHPGGRQDSEPVLWLTDMSLGGVWTESSVTPSLKAWASSSLLLFGTQTGKDLKGQLHCTSHCTEGETESQKGTGTSLERPRQVESWPLFPQLPSSLSSQISQTLWLQNVGTCFLLSKWLPGQG